MAESAIDGATVTTAALVGIMAFGGVAPRNVRSLERVGPQTRRRNPVWLGVRVREVLILNVPQPNRQESDNFRLEIDEGWQCNVPQARVDLRRATMDEGLFQETNPQAPKTKSRLTRVTF